MLRQTQSTASVLLGAVSCPHTPLAIPGHRQLPSVSVSASPPNQPPVSQSRALSPQYLTRSPLIPCRAPPSRVCHHRPLRPPRTQSFTCPVPPVPPVPYARWRGGRGGARRASYFYGHAQGVKHLRVWAGRAHCASAPLSALSWCTHPDAPPYMRASAARRPAHALVASIHFSIFFSFM